MTGSLPLDHLGPVRHGALRPHGRPRKQRLHPLTRFALVFGSAILVATGLEFVIHALRTEPRDAAAIAERELRLNLLESGEPTRVMLPATRRRALDYFRATHGLLVLTDHRLIFLGLRPRDFLAATDAPPVFEESTFPVDTQVSVRSRRPFPWLTRAIDIRAPGRRLRLAVTSASREDAAALVGGYIQHDSALRAAGADQRRVRDRADRERAAALAESRKPRYYTVRRGDAIGSIATQWNVTPELLRAWNRKTSNTIRIGEVLLVRPGEGIRGTDSRPAPFPGTLQGRSARGLAVRRRPA